MNSSKTILKYFHALSDYVVHVNIKKLFLGVKFKFMQIFNKSQGLER